MFSHFFVKIIVKIIKNVIIKKSSYNCDFGNLIYSKIRRDVKWYFITTRKGDMI